MIIDHLKAEIECLPLCSLQSAGTSISTPGLIIISDCPPVSWSHSLAEDMLCYHTVNYYPVLPPQIDDRRTAHRSTILNKRGIGVSH